MPIPQRRSVALLPLLLIAGCASSSDNPGSPVASRADPAVVAASTARFNDAVLQAARDYQQWARVTDSAHVAPTQCRAPTPEGAQVSASKDSDTHGRKLYFLFAKDSDAYRIVDWAGRAWPGMTSAPEEFISPVGQTLVKQSWTATEVPISSVPKLSGQPDRRQHPAEYAFLGERAFKATTQADLFIMLKLDPSTPDTDQGWVYAVTTPDASRVLQAGRIESCMECHVKSDRDRLFGSPIYRPAPSAPAVAPATR